MAHFVPEYVLAALPGHSARSAVEASSGLLPETGPPERHVRVSFQGELGAYGDDAIALQWRGAAEPVPSARFEDVLLAVTSGLTDYGVIPVWNTVVGDIASGRDAVHLARSAAHGLVVVGDVHVAVRHQLLALPEVGFDEIGSVASHPVALAQCGRFLARHPHIIAQPVYDTAGAARELAMNGTRSCAAIAGRGAAVRYGLAILESDIQDSPDNATRFLVLARSTNAPDSHFPAVLSTFP